MGETPAQLLGRDAELSILRTALADAIGGRSRFVVISGEAGIGKSRLLDALADEARASSCLTLTGRAAEFESDVPFAVVIDAVDHHLRTLEQQDIDRLAADRLGALASVFPALAPLGASVDVPVNAGERFRIHRAVGELLERLAARQPVLLVLDDVQWADAASLELAAHLARRPPDGAVAVALGVRTGPAPGHAQRPLASIAASDHVVTVDVPPLDRAALGELIGTRRPDELESWYELTGGNPFFALQLARGGVRPDRVLDDDVTSAVLRSIRVELDTLSPRARAVSTAAAVIGDPFHLDLVINAGTASEDDVLGGLDELCLAGIVEPTATARVFEFRHPIVRSAVYQRIPPGTRIAHHRRIAEQLRSRGADPVELARHTEHSAQHGDLDAVDVLGRAAASVIASAPASAIRWLTTALSLLPASEPPRRRIILLGHLANAHAAVGDLVSGLEALRHSLSIVPAGNVRALTNVSIACAEGERLLGRADVAAETLRSAHEQIPDRNSPEAAQIAIARSANAFYRGAYDDTLKWADEAVRVAERSDDGALTVAARTARLAATAFSGHIEAARTNDNDAVLAWHLFNRSLPELVIGNVEQALSFSDESWRLAEPLPDGMIRGLAAASRASALEAIGRPAEAIELLYRGAGGPELSLIPGAWRGVWFEVAVDCHLALGDTDAAHEAVVRARALAATLPVDLAAATADRAEAAHALATGDAAGGVELLRSAVRHSESMQSPVYVAWSRELLGHALEAAGDSDGAVRELVIASEMSSELGTIRHRDRIDAELRRLGQTVHRRSRRGAAGANGVDSLTGRELEIAQLIRSHATNRTIANELFLSLKTVETHVRNIFNKLGVSSRGEIARQLDHAEPS